MNKDYYFKSNVLLNQFDGNVEIFRSVINEGLSQIPGYLRSLDAALTSSDPEEIHRRAHKLKGGLLSIHADIPARTADMIEKAAATGNFDLALQLKSRLDDEVNEALEEMKKSIID